MCNLTTTLQTLIFILIASILLACSRNERTEKIAEQKPVSINLDTLTNLKKIVDGLEKGNIVESSHIGEGSSASRHKILEG